MVILNGLKMILIFYSMLHNFRHLLAQEYYDEDYAETESSVYYHIKVASAMTVQVIHTKGTSSRKTVNSKATTSLTNFNIITQKTTHSSTKTTKEIKMENSLKTQNLSSTTTKTISSSEKKSVLTEATRTRTSPSLDPTGRKDIFVTELHQKDYTNYSVLLITPGSVEQLNEILQFEYTGNDYNFWSHRRVLDASLIVLLPPTDTNLRDILRHHKIDYTILIDDLQTVFDYELGNSARQIHPSLTGISFNMYLRYDFVMDYLTHLSLKYPEIARLIKIGKTVEGRDISLIEVKDPDPAGEMIGAVLIEAGMHGREWLGVSAALYVINQLVEHANANRGMFDGIFWYILPIFNADGYEYSHTYDRLWKKNKRRYGNCMGVDLDRNFDVGTNFYFKASSRHNCTNMYAGDKPGSESETQALKRFLTATKQILKVYISLHSGDPFIGYPWAHKSERSADYEQIVELANTIKQAIEKQDNSTKFTVDRLYSLCGRYDGAAIDWAKQEGVMYPIMVSLKGGYVRGFDVPSESIFDTVVAAFEGIRAMARFLHIPENKTFVIPENDAFVPSDSITSTTFRFFVLGILISLILL